MFILDVFKSYDTKRTFQCTSKTNTITKKEKRRNVSQQERRVKSYQYKPRQYPGVILGGPESFFPIYLVLIYS